MFVSLPLASRSRHQRKTDTEISFEFTHQKSLSFLHPSAMLQSNRTANQNSNTAPVLSSPSIRFHSLFLLCLLSGLSLGFLVDNSQAFVPSSSSMLAFRRLTFAPPQFSKRASHQTDFPLPSSILIQAMSFSENHQDYSLEALQEYASQLIESNSKQQPSTKSSVCLAVAGGGGHAISTLAATPGASSLLLEGSVLYDRKSYRSYIGFSDHEPGFKYSSSRAATLASEEALRRALQYRSSDLDLMAGCVGIGCASSLVSSSSSEDIKGYGHIVATRSDGTRISINVTLADRMNQMNRTRLEEDIFVSHLILRMIELVQQSKMNQMGEGSTNSNDMVTDAGDRIVEERLSNRRLTEEPSSAHEVAFEAAQRLLEGESKSVVLIPSQKHGQSKSFCTLEYPIIPNGSLVFPGSFNPPHEGHVALAEASVKAAMYGVERRKSTVDPPIFMEVSLTNADKPPIEPVVVADRLVQFLDLDNMPKNWGIILTRAPLFAEKVSSLADCVLDHQSKEAPQLSFVIGTDTMVRILNPKYYENSYDAMLEAIRSMRGVKFIVGGRLEQNKDSDEHPRFVSGEEELIDLPGDVRKKFVIIKEEDFRVDISSSQIRSQMQSQSHK